MCGAVNNIIVGRKVKDDDLGSLIYVGKVLESTTGRSYLGCDVWMDVSFPHVTYITGTRGSGKSFDLGVLVEGISELASPSCIQNGVRPITCVVVDTQSQFWTLEYAPRPTIAANQATNCGSSALEHSDKPVVQGFDLCTAGSGRPRYQSTRSFS